MSGLHTAFFTHIAMTGDPDDHDTQSVLAGLTVLRIVDRWGDGALPYNGPEAQAPVDAVLDWEIAAVRQQVQALDMGPLQRCLAAVLQAVEDSWGCASLPVARGLRDYASALVANGQAELAADVTQTIGAVRQIAIR
jgi:hypothetical protein